MIHILRIMIFILYHRFDDINKLFWYLVHNIMYSLIDLVPNERLSPHSIHLCFDHHGFNSRNDRWSRDSWHWSQRSYWHHWCRHTKCHGFGGFLVARLLLCWFHIFCSFTSVQMHGLIQLNLWLELWDYFTY